MNAPIFIFLAVFSLTSAETAQHMARGGHMRAIAALSGIGGASRVTIVPIQQHLSYFPPAVSADKMSFMPIKRRP